MSLYYFIKHETEIMHNRIIFMLIFSGIATGLLISVINHVASTILIGEIEGRMLFLYITIFLLYLYTQKYFLVHTIYPFNDALYQMRLRLIEKYISTNEFHHQLTHEINLAAQLLPWVSYSAQATSILIFCLIYLAWLSVSVFFLVSIVITSTMMWHLFIEKQLHHEFRDLIVQEKEFSHLLTKLSSQETALQEIKTLSKQSKILKLSIDKQSISSIMSTRIALFLLLAIFVFILPTIDPTETNLIFQITVVTFFIMGPVSQLVYAMPILLRLDATFHSLYTFEAQLGEQS